MLTFLPGLCAGPVPEAWVRSEELLASVARLLRRLHAASAGFVPDAHPFRRLRIFADAYGWNEEERRRLPAFGIEATALSHGRMQHNARTLGGGWARMWDEGVGGMIRRRGTWLEDNAGRLVEALTG